MDRKIKLRVFECAAHLYHGWYQIVDGNRYSKDYAKFEQYECMHKTNPLVLEGTTGFSYSELVQPMKRPYEGICPYLLRYYIISSTKNMFKVFRNMKEKELKGAMEKLDKLKDCGNLFFISNGLHSLKRQHHSCHPALIVFGWRQPLPPSTFLAKLLVALINLQHFR